MQWWALVGLTLVSGSAVLKIPARPRELLDLRCVHADECGHVWPGRGTVMVAIDSLVIPGVWCGPGCRCERLPFNAAAPPVAMWLSAQLFQLGGDPAPATATTWPRGCRSLAARLCGPVFLPEHSRDGGGGCAARAWECPARSGGRTFKNLWLTFIGGGLGAAFVVFALQLGTYGIVVLSLPLLLAVILHFAYRNATGRVADQLHHLAEVNRLHLSTIEALAHAIDAKDGVTHDHIRRVQNQAIALAVRIGVEDQLQLRAIEAAALLHDVGKLAIPEHILNKPGRLTPAEFERMKSHARIGAEILSEVDFPYPVVPIVRHHHENWDGTGYPDGLKGADIPIGGGFSRLWIASTHSHRIVRYRRALSVVEAFAIIEPRRGTMYDPAIVDAFREMCGSSASTEVDPSIDQVETNRTLAAPPGASSEAVAGEAPAETSDEIRLAMGLRHRCRAVSVDRARGACWQNGCVIYRA